MSPKIVVITGPTASGKTALGVALCQKLGGEVVSADSMQIYRGMDIGTAKATAEEVRQCPHHMIDVAEPGEPWSVARYAQEASRCCDDILSRGKTPIITGGTGLYIDSLISGRDFADQGDGEVRERLGAEYDSLGGEEMLRRLELVDAQRARKLHPSDKRRIVRALEIYELTGLTATEHDERTRAMPPRYDAARIVLNYAERGALYKRIDERVDQMVARGLFEEVKSLLQSGVDDSATAMQAIGYKEPAMALRGEISQAEAIELIKQGSRRYAKRQLTWFRRWESAYWISWKKEPDMALARQLSANFIRSRGIS